MKKVWLGATLGAAVLAPTLATAQERTWEWQWGMHPMMFMWGAGGLVMMLMMLVVWGLVIAGLVCLVDVVVICFILQAVFDPRADVMMWHTAV